jgi:bifunctional non-homologous end joining protein LigD
MAKPSGSRSIGLLSESDDALRGKPAKPRDKRQAQLSFDPLPVRIEPALALRVKNTKWRSMDL